MGNFICLVIGCIIGAVVVAGVHSKLDAKTRASMDKSVAATVDSAGATALDGAQLGLTKANQAITDARKNAAKKSNN